MSGGKAEEPFSATTWSEGRYYTILRNCLPIPRVRQYAHDGFFCLNHDVANVLLITPYFLLPQSAVLLMCSVAIAANHPLIETSLWTSRGVLTAECWQ